MEEDVVKFFETVSEGDFITVECKSDEPKFNSYRELLICFDRNFIKDGEGEGWHSGESKFMINFAGQFLIEQQFGIDQKEYGVRRMNPKEYLKLASALSENGYIYNKKTKQLTKINQ